MPKPFAICIENLNARSGASRYLRCVALPGRQPGLRLDKSGQVLWQRDDVVACELWVSADDRLILYRQEGMAPVTLQRAGRSLEVPYARPVVVIDQDQITIGRRRLRLHIHGVAPAVSAPSALPAGPGPIHRLAQAATAAALLGAAMTVGGCEVATPTIEVRTAPPEPTQEVMVPTDTPTLVPTIEVRDAPPAVMPVDITPESPGITPTIEVREFPPTATPISMIEEQVSISDAIQGEWIAAQVYEHGGEQTWITGTLTIEGETYAFKPAGEVLGTSAGGVLDFLFVHPSGEIAIDYREGVAPGDLFQGYTPGDILANCTFRSGSQASGKFQIRVRDATSLEFYQPPSQNDLWKVIKQIEE